MMAEVLELEPAQVLTNPTTLLNPEQIKKLAAMQMLRRNGVPMAYIIGYKDFADFRVKVSDAVLIPRPETEAILAAAIEIAN